VTEATVGQWFKKPGDAVKVDEPLVELETDKVTVEVPAPAAGVLADIKVAQGTTVAIGSVLGSISEGAVAASQAASEAPRPQPITAAPGQAGSQPAPPPSPPRAQPTPPPSRGPTAKERWPPAPAPARCWRRRAWLAADVQGSGRRGQMLKEDVLAAAARPAQPARPRPWLAIVRWRRRRCLCSRCVRPRW
jgi:2-oxoglutarate dehydrogenase E2 component (dihydrolipoamide succinyltransferase)